MELVWHLRVVVHSCGFAFGWILSLYWCQNVVKGFLLLNFTTRFESDTFVAVFEGGTFSKNYVVFIAHYVVLLLRLHYVLYGSVLGFMY